MQHKRISILSAVFALVKNKESGEKLGDLLAELKMCTKTHFEHEEKMMQMAKYPDIKQHEMLHKTMADKTAALCQVQRRSVNGIRVCRRAPPHRQAYQ
jgi:hemerythrin-like metal-binding protein